MQIEPYYQQVLALAIQAIKSREPISFVGMYDSGETYLFTMLIPLADAELTNEEQPAFVDICGIHNEKELVSAITLGFSQIIKIAKPMQDFIDLQNLLFETGKKRPLVICFNIGFDIELDEKFYLMLNQLRNLLGWNFSYLIFANTRLITHSLVQGPALEKLVKRHIVPIKLLDKEQSKITIACYEERYSKKLSEKVKEKIISFSGGNPGIIKALYIQASEDDKWTKPNIYDQRLYFRIQKIVEDLTKEYLKLLRGVAFGKTITDKKALDFFRTFSFIDAKNTIFSPLLRDYFQADSNRVFKETSLPNISDVANTLMSRSERKLIEYLTSHKGIIISRDEIAKLLWGENWADKYSDWAIDQLMHTLREKLSKSKLDVEIKTKKGEGFVLFTS